MKDSPVVTIAMFTALEALRNRLLWLLIGLLAAGFALTEFIAEVAITESVAFQSGFFGALLRAGMVLVTSLFVITSIVRELNDKVLELVLSLPVPRASYYFGKLTGFTLLAILGSALCGICLLVYVPADQALVWSVSLALELLIIIALSLLCLFSLSQVTMALSAVLAFYVLARTVNAFQLIASNPIVASSSLGQRVIEGFMSAMGFLLPDLDRFTRSEWLIYHSGAWSDLLPIAGQTGVYLAFLSGAALFDLYRRSF